MKHRRRAVKLADLDIGEVSGVDVPANDGVGGWLVLKNASPLVRYAVDTKLTDLPYPAINEEHRMDDVFKGLDLESLPADVLEVLEAADAKIQELTAELAKQRSEPSEDDDDEVTKMLLALPEPVRKMVEDAQRDAAEARAEVAKVREEREIEERVAKARAAWPLLPLDAERIGRVLHRVAKMDAGLVDELSQVLTAANEAVAQSRFFTELGSGVPVPVEGSAYAEIVSLAKSKVADGTYANEAAAISAVAAERPDLYARYRAET